MKGKLAKYIRYLGRCTKDPEDAREKKMVYQVTTRKMTAVDYEHLNRLLQKRRTASWNGISKVT